MSETHETLVLSVVGLMLIFQLSILLPQTALSFLTNPNASGRLPVLVTVVVSVIVLGIANGVVMMIPFFMATLPSIGLPSIWAAKTAAIICEGVVFILGYAAGYKSSPLRPSG